MLHMRNRYPSANIVAILLLLASHRHMATNQICLQHKEAQFKMQQGAPQSLEKETSNILIFKFWPPLTTCQPGIAWKPPASTLAHRLAVIHPDIRMRWPEGLGAKPAPSTADARTGTPACAPHPANGVRKDQQHWLSQASESPQTLDLFVGRAKVLGRTSPRCCRPQPNRITLFELLIRLQMLVKSLKNIPPIRLATIRNPQRPNKKDQKGI